MKISYVHGPGNAFGTFLHWKENRDDPGIIKETYSGQFYDLVAEIGGTGQIVCSNPTGPTSDARFRFDTVPRERKTGFSNYISECRYARMVAIAIKAFNPDVIIVSTDFPNYAFDFLSRSIPKILTMHNTFWRPYGKPSGLKEVIFNWARVLSLRNVNLAVCVSLECQRQFRKIQLRSTHYSTIQIPRLPKRTSGLKNFPPTNLLYVGRVELYKGVKDLIYAVKILTHDFPEIRLTIVGDGNALEELKQLVVSLKLDEVVTFSGHLNADGVRIAYTNADLCICPTHWAFNEGLATVPIEAASFGLPTIMSHAVPAKEQFSEQVFLFEPGNVDDLASKLRHSLTDQLAYENARDECINAFANTMHDFSDWKTGILSCIERL